MALQVWLPLTKDLKNQGLNNINFINSGIVQSSTGKLGNSYYFANNVLAATNFSINSNSWSICYWVNYTALPSSSNFYQVTLNGSTSSDYLFMVGGYSTNGTTGVFRCNMTGDCGTINKNTWYHVGATYDGSKCRLYINGELLKTFTIGVNANKTNLVIGGRSNSTTNDSWVGMNGYCYLNDVRIYDNTLSDKEIKQISQGLVLHYPLNNNSVQKLNNCFSYPTFSTSSNAAGWSHWGSTGHQGTYGQSTDPNYIFRKGQSYAHWVADGSEATYNYLLYQSPAFEGGHRSLQCICKEENGLPITESIVYPAWNARSGGAIANKWTSITPLGNGFYHCKCEDIQQDGSNNLVGFYVKIGYKVYFSEAYLENDKEACADIFYPSNTIYDISGFCNNNIVNGNLSISNETPKYIHSTYFDGSSYLYSAAPKLGITGDCPLTLAAWIYCDRDSWISDYAGIIWNNRSSQDQAFSLCMYNGRPDFDIWNRRYIATNALSVKQWYHIVVVKQAGTLENTKIYVNGVEVAAAANTANVTPNYNENGIVIGRLNDTANRYFKGYISDVRIYTTALSAEDVLSLYHNTAEIDSNNNIYGAIR